MQLIAHETVSPGGSPRSALGTGPFGGNAHANVSVAGSIGVRGWPHWNSRRIRHGRSRHRQGRVESVAERAGSQRVQDSAEVRPAWQKLRASGSLPLIKFTPPHRPPRSAARSLLNWRTWSARSTVGANSVKSRGHHACSLNGRRRCRRNLLYRPVRCNSDADEGGFRCSRGAGQGNHRRRPEVPVRRAALERLV